MPPKPPKKQRPSKTGIPAGNLSNAQRDAILRNLAERIATLEENEDIRVAPSAVELRARLADIIRK